MVMFALRGEPYVVGLEGFHGSVWGPLLEQGTGVKQAEKDAVHFSSGWTSVTDTVH